MRVADRMASELTLFFRIASELTELLYEWCDRLSLFDRNPYMVKDEGLSISVV